MIEHIKDLGEPQNSPFFTILRSRILNKNLDKGWNGLIDRIINAAKEVEDKWDLPDKAEFIGNLKTALQNSEFFPNSPLLVNISEPKRRLFACFSVDARRPMDEFLHVAREIHDGMGGIGYSLDHVENADTISNFIRDFDEDTVRNQPGRPRPASNAVTISIDNQGVDAIFGQAGRTKVTNLNVGITEHFMNRVVNGESKANRVIRRLAQAIFETGQPAILFTDRIPKIAFKENTPFASNVCGESPLAADESALLGSLNLVRFLRTSKDCASFEFDEQRFKEVVKLGVRFLDGMHELHDHASPELKRNTLATRKIGIGIMGFAHMMALLGIRYGSDESIKAAEKIGSLLMSAAKEESENLAIVHGPFPAFDDSLGIRKRRNALLTAIAQTSTLSLLVNTSSGIEPIYSHFTRQNILGRQMIVLDPIVEYFALRAGFSIDEVKQQLLEGVAIKEILGEDIAEILPTVLDISGEEQIDVLAAFQSRIDGGISKTLNCSKDTTVGQIEAWIRQAFEKNVLGMMIYRNGSLANQPLEGTK